MNKKIVNLFEELKQESPSSVFFATNSSEKTSEFILYKGIRISLNERKNKMHVLLTGDDDYFDLPSKFLFLFKKYGLKDACSIISPLNTAISLLDFEKSNEWNFSKQIGNEALDIISNFDKSINELKEFYKTK